MNGVNATMLIGNKILGDHHTSTFTIWKSAHMSLMMATGINARIFWSASIPTPWSNNYLVR